MVVAIEPGAVAPVISLGSVGPVSLIGQSRFEEDFMKVSISRNVVGFVLLGLLMILSVSYEAMGQGRSRRVNRWNDKKCAKFVNCHDARDGRWDGRGPNRRIGLCDRIFRRNRRDRDRDRDSDRIIRNRRNRDRDFDRELFWRRRR